jgi:hypothetical protein
MIIYPDVAVMPLTSQVKPLRIGNPSAAETDRPEHFLAGGGPNTDFGASGIGRFGGDWAVAEFSTEHWVSVQRGPHSYPV